MLSYNRSEIAAAALILSNKRLGSKLNIWTPEIAEQTGYTANRLQDVVREVKQFVQEVNPVFVTTLKYKFSKSEYGAVSNITLIF